jgi:uncharacterized protein YbaP (TraB family)
MLWRVGGSNLVLCASAHLLEQHDSVFIPELRAAYEASTRIVFESDGVLAPIPGEVELGRSPQLQAEVSAVAKSFGIDDSSFGTTAMWKVPFVIALQLTHQRGIGSEFGVDARLKSTAQSDGKKIAYLEAASAGPACFVNGGLDRQVERVRGFLSRIREREAEISSIVQAWRDRDIRVVERLYRASMQRDPETGHCFIERRNRAWLPSLITMIRDRTPTLLCAGAMHFVAEVGLPRLLAEQGYVVIPITPSRIAAP